MIQPPVGLSGIPDLELRYGDATASAIGSASNSLLAVAELFVPVPDDVDRRPFRLLVLHVFDDNEALPVGRDVVSVTAVTERGVAE